MRNGELHDSRDMSKLACWMNDHKNKMILTTYSTSTRAEASRCLLSAIRVTFPEFTLCTP